MHFFLLEISGCFLRDALLSTLYSFLESLSLFCLSTSVSYLFLPAFLSFSCPATARIFRYDVLIWPLCSAQLLHSCSQPCWFPLGTVVSALLLWQLVLHCYWSKSAMLLTAAGLLPPSSISLLLSCLCLHCTASTQMPG